MKLIFYFSYYFCLVESFWWSATEPTTEPPIPDAITSEEFYFQDKILQHQFILPGTKYCGPGNRSKGPDDLGRFKNLDLCCRDHDMCPENILAGKYKHGLYNNARFTKVHCDCDKVFHHCLKEVGTPPARVVGALFFTIFHINCFKKEYPIVDCMKRKNRRCLEYKLNSSATPVYQWFDNPFFRHWIDQFPQEMINITLLELNMTATTPINSELNIFLNITDFNFILNDTEFIINGSATTPMTGDINSFSSTTESNFILNSKENSTNMETITPSTVSTSSAPYFGGYFQSFYETVTSYLKNWTLPFMSPKYVQENVITISNKIVFSELNNEINSTNNLINVVN